MKFSDGWLSDHCDVTEAGFDLEDLKARGFPVALVADPRLGGDFKVARVVSIEAHPNADRLRVCRVDDGAGVRQIVCGDQWLREGQVTVLAAPGAKLPCGRVIGVSRLRGVESEGMLCGLDELGLEERSSGVVDLVRKYGNQVEGCVGMSADRVLSPDGRVWDVEVMFNRPDVLCVAGLARELGMRQDVRATPPPVLRHGKLSIDFDNQEKCFVVLCEARVENVSPEYIRRRVSLRGCTPRTYPVDLTNYVLYDVGHPMHAFDVDKIRGGLVLRRARQGESIELLSGEVARLDPGTVVFADAEGPVSIAGVMGGERTKCDKSTKRVLFEAMWLESVPSGIESDACKIFSRGADVLGPRRAMQRLLGLIGEYDGVQEFGEPRRLTELEFSGDEICGILGVDVDCKEYLQRSECEIVGGGGYVCRVPSWRRDLQDVYALAGEVGRLYGYQKLPVKRSAHQGVVLKRAGDVREVLLGLGLDEVLNNHLTSTGCIRPRDAKTSRGLRQSLLPGVWEHCKQQLCQRAVQWAGVFEVGACFGVDNGVVDFCTETRSGRIGQVRCVTAVCNPEIPRFVREVNVGHVALALQDGLGLRFVGCAKDESGVCLIGEGGVRMWLGVLDVAWTASATKHPVYALECVLPTGFRCVHQDFKLKNYSQTWRDLTFVYDGDALVLALLLRNQCQHSQIECIDEYGSAITFRVYMDSTGKIEEIVERCVALAKVQGARLQANVAK